uniref:Ricin B-type lectin domain-containing protein n=1 Tax=Heterorhabditis bacteriophora TaxID=37862 RepID=A0A1I7WDF9_HETBA
MNVCSKWAIFGKQNWRCGMNQTYPIKGVDSRTVAMEVGVCNNSPAESTSPENGWRLSERPIPGRYWLVRWLTTWP